MRCKAGDLAVITRTTRSPEDIGKLVTVISAVISEFWFEDPDGFIYLLAPGHGPSWLIKTEGLPFEAGSCCEGSYAVYQDKLLTPIRPGSLDEETTQSKELEVA